MNRIESWAPCLPRLPTSMHGHRRYHFRQDSTSLRSWLAAVWQSKTGRHSTRLATRLGLGQTAWTKLPIASLPGRERLSGVVEVDECFVGHTPRQQKPVKKKPTIAAIQLSLAVDPTKGFGRIRLSRIAAPSQVLMPFIIDSIAIVHTDGSAAIVCCQKMVSSNEDRDAWKCASSRHQAYTVWLHCSNAGYLAGASSTTIWMSLSSALTGVLPIAGAPLLCLSKRY